MIIGESEATAASTATSKLLLGADATGAEEIDEDLPGVLRRGVDGDGIVVGVDGGGFDDAGGGLGERAVRSRDRSKMASQVGCNVAAKGLLEAPAEPFHLFVEGFHLTV